MLERIDSTVVGLLQEKVDRIDDLSKDPGKSEFQRWHTETQLTLEHIFGEKSDKVKTFKRYNGSVHVYFMDEPDYVLEQRRFSARLSDLTAAKSFLLGLLDFLTKISNDSPAAQKNQLKETEKLESQNYRFHPVIAAEAGPLFNDGYYRDAIRTAYIEVIDRLKGRTGRRRTSNGASELDGTGLMDATFAGNTPVLYWNEMETTAEKDFQQGMFYLFKGVAFLRNEKGHVNVEQKDREKAYEYLCLASLLMRQIDEAKGGEA